MLNISSKKINKSSYYESRFTSLAQIHDSKTARVLVRAALVVIGFLTIVLFLPWTQNIRSRGYVTTLSPGKRPQNVHSIIPGRISQWYVREGDFVEAGDTIVQITEIKDKFFDPQLIERTDEQIASKEAYLESYARKIVSLNNQARALEQTKRIKVQQARNYVKQAILKIKSDSIDLNAAQTQYEIAQKQYGRIEELYKDGLKSLTDLETKKLKLQEANAKLISAENKYLSSQNVLLNARAELNSIENQYNDKLAKVESEKFSASSALYEAEAMISKMRNQRSNYVIRKNQAFILAPQDGYVTKAIVSGVGETVKEGQSIVSIMPAGYDLAVEMYVEPMDLPLIQKGHEVRFMFDGWPSIVFSGWPNASYGTFGGKVFAIDNFISDNGKYRVLVAEDDSEDHPWPEKLRVGSGANGMALLKDVPIWYELWRQLNGFPPDYYLKEPSHNVSKSKSKKESKSKEK